MKTFNEHESVIYTDKNGQKIDTFVINSSDSVTGLTHINHMNLKVPTQSLILHPSSIEMYNLPFKDAFSYEIFKKLKEKYTEPLIAVNKLTLVAEPGFKLAKAS